MKKNYLILLLAILFSGITVAQEPQKKFINYQGVARNGAGQLMANENMTLGIALKMGSASGAAAYAENHSVTTDANGVFSIKIGNGEAVSGAYGNMPWGSEATFVTVLVNGSEIGTTELMAVPYALSSGDGSQSASEVPYDNSLSGLAAVNAQEAIDELVGGGSVDADADPTNEIQTISFDAATNEISLTEGGTITIPSGGTDADADPTNELQTLAFDAGTNELSLSDGNIVTIPSGGTDADADPNNEIQDISLSGTELSISNGSTIDLEPIIPSGSTDDQNLSFDEITNMLQIEDGNTVDLNSLAIGGGSSPWSDNSDGIYYNDGNVGIGTADPVSLQHIHSESYESITRYTTSSTGDGPRDGLAVRMVNNLDGLNAEIYNYEEDGALRLGTRGRSRLNITEDGNVGIGTSNPTAKTHVVHDSDLNSPQLRLEESASDYARLEFKNEDTGYWHIAGRGGDTGDVSKLNFYHHDGTSGRNYMSIAGSGDVGIGTDTPTSRLDVAGNIKTSGEVHGPTTGDANMLALAYGIIRADGDIESGSGNFSVNKIGTGIYDITITGEDYILWDYPTVVSSSQLGFVENGSLGGVMKINTYDISGNPDDMIFNFVVFKP